MLNSFHSVHQQDRLLRSLLDVLSAIWRELRAVNSDVEFCLQIFETVIILNLLFLRLQSVVEMLIFLSTFL